MRIEVDTTGDVEANQCPRIEPCLVLNFAPKQTSVKTLGNAGAGRLYCTMPFHWRPNAQDAR